MAVQPGPNEDEELKWRELWTLPQALIWEQDRCYDLVAFYVRTYLEAMRRGAGAQARTFVRQVSNDLYLAPAALMAGKYVIEGTDDAKAIEQAMATHPAGRKKNSAKERLTIVKPDEPEPDEPEAADDDPPPF
jgi:disulfide oxidoreductase YuzD